MINYLLESLTVSFGVALYEAAIHSVHKTTVGHRPISAQIALFPSKVYVAFVRFIVCSSIGNTIAHAHLSLWQLLLCQHNYYCY